MEKTNSNKIRSNQQIENILNKIISSRNMIGSENIDWVECKICGMKSSTLLTHINSIHSIDKQNYEKKFQAKTICEKYLQKSSERIKGDKNPGYKHRGRLSPVSKKFIKGFDPKIFDKIKNSLKINKSSVTTIDYWLKKTNGDTKKAKVLLKNRQTTFSLEKCIARYGKEKRRKYLEK